MSNNYAQNGMASNSDIIAKIINDPNRLLHRYDETNDCFQFLMVPQSLHRKCTFLTKEHLPADAETLVLRRADVGKITPNPAPIHFIFHSAYCCSTMLARAFDNDGISMSLREPVILNDMVGWRRRGGEPREIAEVLDQSMNWLSKPFVHGESIIVKPSNIVNSLAIAMLAMRPESRAVLLHAPLNTFIRSIAKKNLWGRLWARTLFIGQIKDQMIAPFGMSDDDILQLSDLQVAAIAWLAQHIQFAMIVRKFGPDRIKTLNSEAFLAQKYETMRRLTELFQLNLNSAQLQDILEGPAFNRHSKLDMEFDTDSREREHADAASIHADEIEKVSEWAMVMAKRMNISMTLDSALF